MELARHLLEASDLSIDGIARRAGFGTTASLRQHMHTALGVSPWPTAELSARHPMVGGGAGSLLPAGDPPCGRGFPARGG
ncbi:hypothetical protein ACFWYW_42115 [Nonomuraea sp. NPDC059023]|uniref:hypothetical protein n=1 Tax=unclassified Nonomuraea TaxID=2593643 RepID=UPI00367606B2